MIGVGAILILLFAQAYWAVCSETVVRVGARHPITSRTPGERLVDVSKQLAEFVSCYNQDRPTDRSDWRLQCRVFSSQTGSVGEATRAQGPSSSPVANLNK